MKQVFGVLLTAMCLALLISGKVTLENTRPAVVKPQPLALSDGQQHHLSSRSVNPLSQPVAITKKIAMPAQELTSGGTEGKAHTLSINSKNTFGSVSAKGNKSATTQITPSAQADLTKIHSAKVQASKVHSAKAKATASASKSTSTQTSPPKKPQEHHLTPNMKVPSRLIPVYQGAGKRYSIPWTVLAAIHDVETHFAVAHFPVSSAGARGPMQFMPAIFRQYGVTAPGQHGKPNILNVPDAVYSAAHMLSKDGYQNSPSRALYLYNHSWAYVHRVLYLAGLH